MQEALETCLAQGGAQTGAGLPQFVKVEEQGMTWLADTDADHPLASLQAASCTYRIALGPRAGQVLSLRTVAGREEKPRKALCAAAHGFSLHAAVRLASHPRKELEQLCRTITRPALANERLTRNARGTWC
ncbi:MAG: transposase [Betaproteobacteria bacterium]